MGFNMWIMRVVVGIAVKNVDHNDGVADNIANNVLVNGGSNVATVHGRE